MDFIEKKAIRNFKKGEFLCMENDKGNSMFIIQSGEVEVSTQIRNQKTVLAKLGSGAIIGEMALIDRQPRSATVRALTNVICLEINENIFQKLLGDVPPWMRSFYLILVERLRKADKRQRNMEISDIARQVFYFLDILLNGTKEDQFGNKSLNWNKIVEQITFIMNIDTEIVRKLLGILINSKLAKSELNYEKGRQFITDKFDTISILAEYSRAKYMEARGFNNEIKFKPWSKQELAVLSLISIIMGEQGKMNEIPIEYFEDKCRETLERPLNEYKKAIRVIKLKSIIKEKNTSEGVFFKVDNEKLKETLENIKQQNIFTEIEKNINRIFPD